MANSLVYGRGNIDERTVTICSGIDFVQISHTNITGADPTTAKVILIRYKYLKKIETVFFFLFFIGMD
jgi:hypothetical protein